MTSENQQPQEQKPQISAANSGAPMQSVIPFSKAIIEKLQGELEKGVTKAKADEEKAEKNKKFWENWSKFSPFWIISGLGAVTLGVGMTILTWIPATAPIAWAVALAGGLTFALFGVSTLISEFFARDKKVEYEEKKIFRECKEKELSELKSMTPDDKEAGEFKQKYQLDDARYEQFIRNYMSIIENFDITSAQYKSKVLRPDEGDRLYLNANIIKASLIEYFQNRLNKELVDLIAVDKFDENPEKNKIIMDLLNASAENQTLIYNAVNVATQHAGALRDKDIAMLRAQAINKIFEAKEADIAAVEKAIRDYPAFHKNCALSEPIIHPTPQDLVDNIIRRYLDDKNEFKTKLEAERAAEAATAASKQ